MVMHLILLIIKKEKTKITLLFILKDIRFIFTVKEFSFYCCFDLKRELDLSSSSALVTKLFYIDEPRIDIHHPLLCSLVFGLLQFTLKKHVGYEREGILKVA